MVQNELADCMRQIEWYRRSQIAENERYAAIRAKIKELLADRATLAAGVEHAFDMLPNRIEWENPDKIDKAIEVVDRLNGEASGGSAPRLAKPPAEPDYDEEPPPRAPGHVCGPEGNCDCDCMNLASVELAQPTGKMTLADRLAEMRHEVDGILKRGGSSHITEIINAIHAVALVVDGVANSHKVDA